MKVKELIKKLEKLDRECEIDMTYYGPCKCDVIFIDDISSYTNEQGLQIYVIY